MLYDSSRAVQEFEPVAVIRQLGSPPLVEVRNTLLVGEAIEYMPRGTALQPVTVTAMRDAEGRQRIRANPGNRLYLETEPRLNEAEVHGILRRRRLDKNSMTGSHNEA